VVLGSEENIVSALRAPAELDSPIYDGIDLSSPLRAQTKRALQNLERKIILGVLQANNWNRRKTARSLDISYRALLYKIKEAGLPPIRAPKAPSHNLTTHDAEEISGTNRIM
jgi:two-component system, NtrC family, response regulator AtoC